MPRLREDVLLAFRDELSKEAGFGDLVAKAAPRLKNMGSLGGAGAAVGALGGAGIGAIHQYREAKRQGASTGEAVLGGLSGAVSGAGKGALYGGLAGAAGGALARGDWSGLGQRSDVIGLGSRFGQRQLHGFTGMLSPAELEAVRGGAYDARQAFGHALEHEGDIDSAYAALRQRERVTGVGPNAVDLTSMPGVVRSVRDQGFGKVLRAGVQDTFHGASPTQAALMAGVPAVMLGREVLSKNEFNERGQGRAERVAEEAGRTLGGFLGAPMPIIGNSVLSEAVGRAGRYVGRGVDRLRGKIAPPQTHLEPTEAQATPSEYIMSPAAAGQHPEI